MIMKSSRYELRGLDMYTPHLTYRIAGGTLLKDYLEFDQGKCAVI